MLPEEKLSLALQRGITARENILFPGELMKAFLQVASLMLAGFPGS